MIKKFLAWWNEIWRAGSIMDAYTDDSIARLEPGKNRHANASQRRAWSDAADWALTKVDD